MISYKYFRNVKKDAYFTDMPCQFCGSMEDCLDGIFFQRENVTSVCMQCFEEGKAQVYIP